MATGGKPQREARVRNVVHDDAICHHHNQKGTPNSSSSTTVSLPPIKSHHPLTPLSSGLPSKLPPGLSINGDDSILEDWLVSYRVPEIIKLRMPQDKYSVPATTNLEVGWVWGNSNKPADLIQGVGVGVGSSGSSGGSSDGLNAIGGMSGSGMSEREKVVYHTLERFPREAHGKRNILKWWGGGRESMP
ncbi:hypothetical protein HDU76_013036 [Blyttiomyces sp. JEL0837]|nr:hypothetical protein HDU76_013036 [Blyttiomyces sp. JEL0837]